MKQSEFTVREILLLSVSFAVFIPVLEFTGWSIAHHFTHAFSWDAAARWWRENGVDVAVMGFSAGLVAGIAGRLRRMLRQGLKSNG